MNNPRDRDKLLGYGQYPSEYDEDAPVPPALLVLFCQCYPGDASMACVVIG
jgi:hypothetical protein